MKTIFGILTILSLFSACKQGPVVTDVNSPCSLDIHQAMDDYYSLLNDENPNNDPEQTPRECNVPMAEPGASLTHTAVLRDFNSEQEEKMKEALKRAVLVLNSTAFKDKVLDHTYNGERTYVDNNDQTNEEIYETIMKGVETLQPDLDYEIDWDITLYYSMKSTVGYTYPDVNKIWVNSKFFNGYNYGQVAANAVHEWTHKLGYGHSYYSNASRPYSVPYAIGSIIEELVNAM